MDRLKALGTPLATVTFLVVGVSGVMMFFHLGERAVKELHEWFGVAMVVAVVLHLLKNLRPFVGYLRGSRLLWGLAVAGTLVTAGMVVPRLTAEEGGRGGPRAVLQQLEQARVADVAPAFGLDAAAAIDRLAAAGVSGATPEATIADLAGSSERPPTAILELLIR